MSNHAFEKYQRGEGVPGLLSAEAFGRSTDAPNLLDQARVHVFNYVKNRLEKTDTHVTFAPEDVYVVWFTKTLKNWKAMVSTKLPDGMYYEVTYNGEQRETYLDAYKKFENVCIPDEE